MAKPQKPKKRKRPMLSVTIDPKIHQEFTDIILCEGYNKSLIVERAIESWLKKYNKK